MNNSEKKRNRGADRRSPWEKYVKKTTYRVQTRSLRKVIVWALIVGILVSLFHGLWNACSSYASSYAQVSMVFPEIADGKYPDGSRFSAYDLISEDRIQEALDVMQGNGVYEEYTAKQLAEQFDIYTYTEGSVADDVSTLRSEGNNYSYFANEYRITFTQPRDPQSPNFLSQLKAEDHSAEFLNVLMEQELKNIREYYGGTDGFAEMTDIGDISGRDYSEQVSAYQTRINIILSYLKSLNGKSGGYVSENTGKNLMELISRYEVLLSQRLNQLQNFIQTSGLTKDRASLMNKLNVRLEELEIYGLKYEDEAAINGGAKDAYDHTFTENRIVISTSDMVGLYQARPKTAFDTVVNNYNAALERAVKTKANIAEVEEEIRLYSSLSLENPKEADRMTQKCEELLNALRTEYSQLCQTGVVTLDDYLAEINEQYVSYKVETSKLVSGELLANAAMAGLAAAVLVFALYAIGIGISDLGKICIKRIKLKRMRTYRDQQNTVY